ncbi:serine/threonine protein kinase [Pendulispora rubella]|uniref:Serine/threonine protein kinase n=1 Tax=Pendulispora rubella TaxID=2741070 RepID=A0ABZ2LKD2_9BACT
MKSCPKCQRVYPNDAGFCAADGTGLVFTSMVPVASEDDRRIGLRLCNRYEIRRVIADGGMGRVYEGVDKATDTRIAVKVLHDDVARDEVSVERFRREFEISAKLPHDHIVQVLDFQQDPQTRDWLMVMEFLDGEELRLVLRREHSIAPERVIRMLSQTAIGLDAAHAINFVHRDLKPDNLFLCGSRDGDIVKILDFGSVKDKNTDAKKLTVLGTTIGSPYYMAPEQAQGLETLDSRADVFALAAIAYECLCGGVPFPGTNGPSILLAILTKDADAPSVRCQGRSNPPPPALDDVMEEALAKNPNIRTQSVGMLADAVGRAYGLTGDHFAWARMAQGELAQLIETARPHLLKTRQLNVLEAAADPFAMPAHAGAGMGAGLAHAQSASGGIVVQAPDGGAVPYGALGGNPAAGTYTPAIAPPPMHQYDARAAEVAARTANTVPGRSNGVEDEPIEIAGLSSKGQPKWLLPAIAGGVVLLLLIVVLVAMK